MAEPEPKCELSPYNPASDEPKEIRYFACIWELLRRHREFQRDAELWIKTWNDRAGLLDLWESMAEADRIGPPGKSNLKSREDLSQTLFAITNGSLSYITWPAIELPVRAGFSGKLEPTEAEMAEHRRRRAWHRSRFILYALEWMLPAALIKEGPPDTDEPRGAQAVPEKYEPTLTADQLVKHQKFGSLSIAQAWPQTSPFFRKQFARACTPGQPGDKLEKFNLHHLAEDLIRLGNEIKPGSRYIRASTSEELAQVRRSIYGVATGLMIQAQRNKCFLIPDGRVYPRSQFKAILSQIEGHFETFRDGCYPKASFLGRVNQWDAYLTAESLARVNGHLDHYGSAKLLVAQKLGTDAARFTISSLAKNAVKDVRERCDAIEHWISCVYPGFAPKPYLSRHKRK